jgi:hypothetical protein
MGDNAEQIQKIARDLLCIEVNTILKPMMTGRKMPEPHHALIDIAEWYETKVNVYLEKPYELTDRDDLPYYKRFDSIRDAANDTLKKGHEGMTEEDKVMLLRIKRMSDQIKSIFEGLAQREGKKPDDYFFSRKKDDKEGTPETAVGTSAPPKPECGLTSFFRRIFWRYKDTAVPSFNFITDDLVLIRKIWELGVETIVMQTVVQLDGDVVTRLRPDCANDQCKALHAIHNQTVATSVQFWSQLIGTLADFFKDIIKNLLGRK